MNRYERLVGHTYRQLVADTRRIMSGEKCDDIVASVLLFKSYNESFYYVGTEINPLIKPSQLNASLRGELHEVKLLKTAPELFWYLGAYLCSQVGESQIDIVFNLSDELAAADALTFNISYPEFAELKELWRGWIRDNRQSFRDDAVRENPKGELLRDQAFVFANFLLTLMPIPVSETVTSSASAVYNVLIGDTSSASDADWIDPVNANFRIQPDESYQWRYVERDELAYGQLLDLVEFILIQPVIAIEKEKVLKSLYDSFLIKDEIPDRLPITDYEMTALARPLIHNTEFQGIVYVARMFNGRGFNKIDEDKFHSIINSLQVSARLYEAGFALAQLALLRKDASDWNDPSLVRLLNIMHFFTSASAGFVIYEDDEGRTRAYERYRAGEEMETLPRADAEKMRDTIQSIFAGRSLESGAIWFSNKDADGARLLSLPSNGEKKSNSVVVMSFSLPQKGRGYFVLFYRFELERLLEDYKRGPLSEFMAQIGWDVYMKIFSTRLHSSIERLIDVDSDHKRMLTFERQQSIYFLQRLSLLTIHDVKNNFEPLIVTPLKEIAQKIPEDKDTQEHIYAIASWAERFMNQSSKYATAFKNFFHLRMISPARLLDYPWKITPEDFKAICEKLQEDYSAVDKGAQNMKCEVNGSARTIVGLNRELLEFLLDQLLSNAMEADRENGKSINERQYVLVWGDLTDRSKKPEKVQISVWNAGAPIPEYIRNNAGRGIPENPREGHTGFGFQFLEYTLSQLGALEVEEQRHFVIENTLHPGGVSVSFVLPAVVC
jgi:hypothetical protein